MTNETNRQVWDEDPIILLITFLSIAITLIREAIQCALTLHTPKAKSSDVTSVSTRCTKTSKAKSQPQSASTSAECITVGLRKEVGTTNVVSQSAQSASSAKSRQSKKPSTSKPTPGRRSVKTQTPSVGQPIGFATTTNTPRRIQKSGLAMSDGQQ